MNYSVVDTHCHLDIIEMQGLTIPESLENAYDSGVKKIIQIGIDEERNKIAKEISKLESKIDLFYTAGCHPADSIPTDSQDRIQSFIQDNSNDPKFIGIGEIGLDYYHDKDNHQFQKETFRRFLEIASELNYPVIIHSRDAAEDTYQILKEFKEKVFGVIHCFTYDSEYAKKFYDIGYYISFSGVVAFKNATSIQEAVVSLPLDGILVETDAPFLSPPPHRGKRNEPAYVSYVLKKVLELRTESRDKVSETIFANSLKLINREPLHA
ncbi:MAG: TatD family hydrolase [Leptospiraceae bacterium]|nr:TatD family hydrolase [Leptospiraceae bacterium]